MSDKPTDGGPAFPGENATRFGQPNDCNPGMSLRDYFAAKAITAAAQDELLNPTYDEGTYKGTAVRAYLYADAMLKARTA